MDYSTPLRVSEAAQLLLFYIPKYDSYHPAARVGALMRGAPLHSNATLGEPCAGAVAALTAVLKRPYGASGAAVPLGSSSPGGRLSGAEFLNGDGEALVVVACLDARPRPRDGVQAAGHAAKVAQLLLRVSPNAPRGDGSTSKRGGGRWG